MHDRHVITEKRVERFLLERIRPARYSAVAPFTVTAYDVPGEPISFDDVMLAMVDGEFHPFDIGGAWGRAWGTTWFHVVGRVPHDWAGATVEARIDLGFGLAPGFQAEGLVWGPDGPLRALNPLNHAIPLLAKASGGEEFEFLVEAAANPMIGGPTYGPTPLGDPETLPDTLLYRLKRAELTVFHSEVAELVHDLDVLGSLIRELPMDAPRRPQITVAIGRALDALDLDDVVATAEAARAELVDVLAKPAVPSAHRVTAIGHAHIDTAWMWPLRETVRKCARTFSNVLDLMTREPELTFVCSQAQQHEWMREHYPSVFADMQVAAAAGRFVPVGGMWVEPDMNLPSGESLARQFLHGQRFFEQHYGAICGEVWIPDVFGYPASLPQIFRLGGAEWFLTQKLSWNKQNRMPHHTFHWQGIDGTTIFTHFPPVDTYNVSMQPAQLAHAERNYADHGGATMSMAPFGYGNGGGGPTREMMARYRRMRDLEGLPRMDIATPAEWFPRALDDYVDAPTWVGELYFEMHRGTYTSQAKTKAGNRRTEFLLGEVELWSAVAADVAGFEYPLDELREAWQETLTLQFHDIIPGSSIAWVHDDAEAAYDRLRAELAERRDAAIGTMAGRLGGEWVLANSAPFERGEVVELPDGRAAYVEMQPMSLHGWADVAPTTSVTAVTVGVDGDDSDDSDAVVIDNGLVRLTIDRDGLVASVVFAGREVVRADERLNVLELSSDNPVEYDAWDIDEYYAATTAALTAVDSITVIDRGPLLARVRVERRFGASAITQDIVVRAGSARIDFITDVSWHENEKILKAAFPVDVHADTAACEIQYGHVHRPMHRSTNWDAAKFEVCAHRWIDVSERDFGVALLNDSKYGHDIQRGALRITLLRAANFPDPDADRGDHRFTYSLFPHTGDLVSGGVLAEATNLNQPIVVLPGAGGPVAHIGAVAVTDGTAVVTAVKHAEDGSGDLIIRCYEPAGNRVSTQLALPREYVAVVACDLLERPLDSEAGFAALDGVAVDVDLRPFQIVTLRLS
jgi:alpha-mannosidase